VPVTGTVLADSTYPGLARPIAISRRDRTMHMWLCGPTGVGKSTLITNMAVQDAQRGDGFAVVDPKGDLVREILARLPESRQGDVIVIDPSDTAMPVGFNLLGAATTEAERELATDQVLYVLRQQWEAFWGPRTDAVLRAALLTLTHVPAPDGSAFTLCEIPEILTNAGFRRRVVGEPTVPTSVRQFWHWFEGVSDGERAQVVGPVLNKLGAFTQRTPLRLMLGQSIGVDLARAMRNRKIILVPLGRGQLGAETAALVGSLLVAGLWQATLGRIAVPVEQRRPYWLYIDEAQEVVRLPVDVADMVAEARGYGLGMTFANQHLSQLPESVRRALLSTVRSQIVFQVEADDARVLARSFAPSVDEADLRSLPAYEVAMRLCIDGQTSRPITGRTRPLGEPINEVDALRRESRTRYGTPRSAVEEALRNRLATNAAHPAAFGRRRADGGRR
jgi:type IV secretory pathway TraG/TraD family ATPase VirD4